MIWLDQKYVGLLSSRLEGFTKKDKNLWNFRCFVCGDSQTNKKKARGYVYKKNDNLMYHCHNCGITMGVPKMIDCLDHGLYKEYVKEKLFDRYGHTRQKTEAEVLAEKMKKPVFVKYTQLNTLKKISQLPVEHPARKYVVDRKIPNFYHSRLFYAPKFKTFVNRIVPNKFTTSENDTPRLIIPLLDEHKSLIGFQGRSLLPDDEVRYISIMLDPDAHKVFNLDRVDMTRDYFVFEGPFDSMFIENSIAMAGGSIDYGLLNDNAIIVYDNEPRSIHTVKKMKKAIEVGLRVAFWSPKYEAYKDVNDMVVGGKDPDVIRKDLFDTASRDLEATLLLKLWRKV